MTDTIVVEEDAPVNSRKRETTAVVISTVVAVALTAVASIYIGKIQHRVKTKIAPEPVIEVHNITSM